MTTAIKVKHVDDSATIMISVVRQVVVLDNLVAVVGDHMWAAWQGLDALKVTWDEGPNAKISSADIWNDLAGGLVLGFQWPLRGAPVNEPEQLAGNPNGQFAPNAFIRIDNTGKTTLVIPQAEMGQGVYTAIAMILAEDDKVIVNNHYLGGGFGRRLEPDMVEAAVRIAKQVSTPLKVVYYEQRQSQRSLKTHLLEASAGGVVESANGLLGPAMTPVAPGRRAGRSRAIRRS